MGVLTDADLKAVISEDRNDQDAGALVISPCDPKCLTPVGYDLRVGKTYATSDRSVIEDLAPEQILELRPRTTALIETPEYIGMPKDRMMTGLVESKVRQVSRGLSHISTTVDADWRGELLIAVHNHAAETLSLKYGDPFCTLVFLKNRTAAVGDCDKQSGRPDILLERFRAQSARAQRRKRRSDLIPPAIVAVAGVGGYAAFGNSPGFAATVAAGVAVSQFVERRYLR